MDDLSKNLENLEIKYGGCHNPGDGYWEDRHPFGFSEGYNKNIVKQKMFEDPTLFFRTLVADRKLRPYEVGGDRMNDHVGYHKIYAEYLPQFIEKANGNLCEIGILKGIGLAIWCDIFNKEWNIYGLDLDLSNMDMKGLTRRGAFAENKPILHEYNQFVKQSGISEKISGKIDVVIDDASHMPEGIINSFLELEGQLNEHFIYFVEDVNNFDTLIDLLRVVVGRNSRYKIIILNSMIIITNK